MREYKRKEPFNKVKEEHIKKIQLHLDKTEELKNVSTNIGSKRDSV